MKALFPYPVLFGDVSLDINGVSIDDDEARGRINSDQRTVDLFGVDREVWETARFGITVAAPSTEISASDDVRCFAIINCGRSNHRQAIELDVDADNIGRWSGEISLERNYWYATADLTAVVVSTVDNVPHRIIGTSTRWQLEFDDLPHRPIGGAITVTWVDFADPGEDRQFLKEHADNYVFLSIDPDEPQLFLNRGFEGLEQVLADRRRTGLDKALHDQTRAAIADKTWSALFNAALDGVVGVDEDGDGLVDWPVTEWQQTVLEALLVRMYPDKSSDEALHDAYSTRHSPDSPGSLQMRLVPAASMQARAPRLLRDGIRTLLRLDPTAEVEEEA